MKLLALLYPTLFTYPDESILEECFINGSVLDLGCATGRVLNIAGLKGLPISGVDSDPEMLARAQEILAEFKGVASMELVRADFTELNIGDLQNAPFGTIVCAANTWGMIGDSALRSHVLNQCRLGLRPDGNLLIWVKGAGPTKEGENRIEKTADVLEGRFRFKMRWDEDFHAQMRRYHLEIQLGGRVETHTFDTKIFSQEELLAEFSEAEFQLAHAWGDFNRGPLHAHSPFQIFQLKPR